MNFKEYIELHRNEVYSKICEYVKIKDPIEHYKMVRDYIDRQGSYRRPGLLMLSGEVFGANKEELVTPAAAMQLSEDWILVHDDAEDDSELRRGKPALHRMHGIEQAINVGDAGHAAMWRMVKDHLLSAGMEKGNRFYEKFYDMIEYTVEGQYIDTNFFVNIRDLKKASEDLYFRIVESKTCYYSVYGPLQLGAIVANADQKTMGMLKDIGAPAGRAFQIIDDVLDMTADEKLFGKKNYGDLYEGKLTLIILNTYKNATEAEKTRIDEIYKKRRKGRTDEEVGFLIEIIDKYDGIEYAKSRAKAYGEEAKSIIERYKNALPNNEYTETMLSAVEELYMRKK